MDFQVSFKVNEKIFIKNPEHSEIGRQIVKHGIDLIHELGFEHFTFKKLALDMQTTEATIYRYFENKHRLLLYILNWYWSYLEFMVMFQLRNIKDDKVKLSTILDLLTNELPDTETQVNYNKSFLHQIVITESSKVYLVKEVNEINQHEVFKPYKDLCGTIANIISSYNPNYKFPHSLSSTLIETAHDQQFFAMYLPRLTDVKPKTKRFTFSFLQDFLFKILDAS
ncbi:MAG TPA: TetR/AcrR family transcriptional regulator [Chitinophagaceae bacterium]|nr:TetR/AcrR family transcriptional regulator [Chitinophagaceae bacterium]